MQVPPAADTPSTCIPTMTLGYILFIFALAAGRRRAGRAVAVAAREPAAPRRSAGF